MAGQSLTLSVPQTLYEQLKARAEHAQRSVEDETLDLLAAAVPARDQLPAELAEAVAGFALLDDAALWQAARSSLAADESARLEELHLKRQREGLTGDEEQKLAATVRQYEHAMLVRAQAASLLHQRGHDVSELAAP